MDFFFAFYFLNGFILLAQWTMLLSARVYLVSTDTFAL